MSKGGRGYGHDVWHTPAITPRTNEWDAGGKQNGARIDANANETNGGITEAGGGPDGSLHQVAIQQNGAQGQATTTRREGRNDGPIYCKNCKLNGFHQPDSCFELEKNKSKRPKDWVS